MSVTMDYRQQLLNEVQELPQEALPNLLQIIHLFKESVLQSRQAALAMQTEFEQWDRLSDEALVNFEQELPL